MIKFLKDYTTKSVPPETFTAGEVVDVREEPSEMHFVVRGVAAFVGGDGKLTDFEGKPVADPFATDAADDDGDGLDKLSTSKLKKLAKAENVELAADADDAAIRAAIRAQRAAAAPATDGLDDLTDEQIAEKVTTMGVAVEPGADRATMLAALREAISNAPNGQ